MTLHHSRTFRACLPFAAALLCTPTLLAQSQTNVSISLDSTQLRRAIPSDFLGLSFEMSSIMAANNKGTAWMSGTPGPLSNMLMNMGVKNIRIGGNSSERVPYATTDDAASVDAFANLIGANLIWNVPVKTYYNPANAVPFVQAMFNDQHVAHSYPFATNIEIGNEPDNDDGTTGSTISYATWQSRYDTLSNAFRTQVDPSILSTGPSAASCCTYPNGLEADSTYQSSLKSTIGSVTVHSYPLGASTSFTSINDGDTKMLASTLDAKYQTTYNKFNNNASNNGYNVRIEETNSAYGGSNNGVTNSYAAALWALDYFCYMAYNTNMGGMNLHNGPIGSNSGSYNAISPIGVSTTPLSLQPPGYGLWAFNFGGQGQPVKTTLSSADGANVTAYGLLATDGSENVHVINRTFGTGAEDATVTITPDKNYAYAQVIYLQQASGDVTARSGITFGGAAVDSNGNWNGGYGAAQALNNGAFTFTLPHAQAAVVHFLSGNPLSITIPAVSASSGSSTTMLTANASFAGPIPTGTVGFLVDGQNPLNAACTLSDAHTATCQWAYPTGSLAAGAHSITAFLLGDSNYPTVNATGTLTIY